MGCGNFVKQTAAHKFCLVILTGFQNLLGIFLVTDEKD